MAMGSHATGIAAGRLERAEYAEAFTDLHPPLSVHEARVQAQRCYFCHDAPCMTACPTSIDVPLFIRQIATGNPGGAGRTILRQNIMGGMCARVCPTETLCEQVCVRNEAEGQPVNIGRLQRFATDHLMANGGHPFTRAAASGKSVAVVGAGPAGMACAHRLAMLGHGVTVYDAREKPGGLNEYGLAAYKTPDDFAAREISFILGIGGIEMRPGTRLGRDLALADLQRDHDAVFLGLGMGGVNGLGLAGEDLPGVEDAVDYIARLRQADDLATLPVGRQVVVIGGGMTAIDIAVQTKRLGAEQVTIAYRRGPDQMKASDYECELAQTNGVQIRYWSAPVELIAEQGRLAACKFEYQAMDPDGRLEGTGETYNLDADQLFKAIGQTFLADCLGDAGIELKAGRIAVDADRRTSLSGVWAGGDCIDGGDDLTVAAVDDGAKAAEAIHQALANI